MLFLPLDQIVHVISLLLRLSPPLSFLLLLSVAVVPVAVVAVVNLADVLDIFYWLLKYYVLRLAVWLLERTYLRPIHTHTHTHTHTHRAKQVQMQQRREEGTHHNRKYLRCGNDEDDEMRVDKTQSTLRQTSKQKSTATCHLRSD